MQSVMVHKPTQEHDDYQNQETLKRVEMLLDEIEQRHHFTLNSSGCSS